MSDENVDAIIAVGGDGTINEALNGMIGTEVPLGIIPCGTANDLAHHLGIPTDLENAVSVIGQGRTQRIDLIRVNDWYMATTGGIGIASIVIQSLERIKYSNLGRRLASTLGGAIYLLTLLLTGFAYR
jgi:diacylglycerol kinase family enzyme